MKIKFSFVLVTLNVLIGSVFAAPVISPYAVDLPIGNYSSNAGGSSQGAFNGGSWNAGWWGTYWIQADMGSEFTLSEVKLVVSQLPNGVTSHSVFISDSFIGDSWINLTPVAVFNGFTVDNQLLDLVFSPTRGRFLEIVSDGGASWTALGGSAGAEDVVWTDPVDVPEPASVALLGLGVMGLGVMRRRKAGALKN